MNEPVVTMRRFTLRDLFWLTTLVALGGGWYADHVRQEAILRREKTSNIEAAVKLQIEWLKRYRGEWRPKDSNAP